MEKNKRIKLLFTTCGLLLVLSWSMYSYLFHQVYNEAAVFATEGAQPIVQILEILNYRGDVLLPFFIFFFILVGISLFYIVCLFVISKQRTRNYLLLLVASLVISIFIGFNLLNKLFLLLIILVIVALLIMVSIWLTVRYLYFEKTDYEAGDIIRKKGPFKKLSDAHLYEEQEMKKIKKLLGTEDLVINSVIYLESSKGHYVEIFLEELER